MAVFRNDWANVVGGELEKPYYRKLREFLKREYARYTVYPNMYHIYNALHFTSYSDTKVVILGQDPYHGPGQAHGLSFSVQHGVTPPPSLKNIFVELENDLGIPQPPHGCLEAWARQGVLLLNAVLTVREGQPNSHRGIGWETFTDEVIKSISRRKEPAVFVLWGAQAQAKEPLIDKSRHAVIKSPHPSPLSAHRGFFGSRPFSRVNAYLRQWGMEEIDWRLPEAPYADSGAELRVSGQSRG
jgi:uracil-DNA glycosylase